MCGIVGYVGASNTAGTTRPGSPSSTLPARPRRDRHRLRRLHRTTPGLRSAPASDFYWRYEKFIRRNESRTASTPGASGAIDAIRRELFEPVPDDTILDDVLIPLRIARRGYRVVLETQRQVA